MGISIGSSAISAMYAGTTPITAVYKGSTQVWAATPTGLFAGGADDMGFLVQTHRTSAAMPIGAAHASRIVFALIGTGSAATSYSISNVKIGGVAATLRTAHNSGNSRSFIYSAAVPTGTTAVVTLNTSAGTDMGVYAALCYWYGNMTVVDSISTGTRTTGANLATSVGDSIIAIGKVGDISPTTGGALSSSPAGMAVNPTISILVGTEQIACGFFVAPQTITTNSVTASWNDASSPSAISAISIRSIA